jgi:flagellar biosynthetic protein FlhB
MPDQDRDQKTERATPRRREDARKKGQVARSKDLNTALILLLAAVVLYMTGPSVSAGLRSIFRTCFTDYLSETISVSSSIRILTALATGTVTAILPLMGGVLFAAALASYGQVGFVMATDPLGPKFERLNPVIGVRRLCSAKSLVSLATSLAKVAVVGLAAYLYLRWRINDVPPLLDCSIPAIYEALCRWTFELVFVIAMAFLIIAATDYAFQRWDFERDIRMTKEELREELKRSEGDPLVKSRVRQIQREMASRRMMQDVPQADVVIKNPTHYAVALRYKPGKNLAPAVVAKGMNLVARKILEIAREHGVPEVENKPLAQTLYKTVEIGQEIPPILYKAVAEVLAYVYRLRTKRYQEA